MSSKSSKQSTRQARTRSAESPESRVRTKPRPTPGIFLLFLMAMVMVVAGGAATIGVHFAPDISRYTEILGEVGLEGGQLLTGGLLLYGVALLGRYQRMHATTLLLAPSTTEKSLVALAKGIAELRPKLQELLGENAQLRLQVETVRQEALEARQKDRGNEPKDALFRLAGSLDTLHAKLDRSLTESSTGLHGSIDELATLIESSRDYIQEGIEESEHRTEKRMDELTSDMRKLTDEMDSGVSDLTEVIESLSELSGQLPEMVVEHEDEEAHGLDILVDLEELEEDDEDQGESGLGLLDRLDDELLEEDEQEKQEEQEETTTAQAEASDTSSDPAPVPDVSTAPSLPIREQSTVLGPDPGALLEPESTTGPPAPTGEVPPIKIPPMAIPPIQIPGSSPAPPSQSLALPPLPPLPPMPGSGGPTGQASPSAPLEGAGPSMEEFGDQEAPADGGPSVIRLNDPAPPLPGKSQPLPDPLMSMPERPDSERSEN